MARNSLGKEGLTLSAYQAIKVLGKNIQTARKRRGWTLEEMAGCMLVTRKTLSRLESGDPACIPTPETYCPKTGMGETIETVFPFPLTTTCGGL